MRIPRDLDVAWYTVEDLEWMAQTLHVCFESEAWTLRDLSAWIARDMTRIAKVISLGTQRVGVLLYQLNSAECRIRRVGVLPAFRRRSVGSGAILSLAGPRSLLHQARVTARVRERNLAAQQFLATLHFMATTPLVRDAYPDTDEDGIWFEYRRFGGQTIPNSP